MMAERDPKVTAAFSRSLTLCLLVILAYVFTTTRVDETLRTGLAVLIFASLVAGPARFIGRLLWPGILAAFVLSLIARPIDVPNHHWMMTYLSAAITVCCWCARSDQQRFADLAASVRWLIVVLMGLATVQKLFSPTFMDGTYIGYELARGSFATPVLKFMPENYAVVQSNVTLIDTFHHSTPETLPQTTLAHPYPSLKLLSHGFSASILVMEAWLCFCFVVMPKRVITHLSLIAFAGTLAVLRQEFTFISVVCVLGMLSCGESLKPIRRTYALLAILTAAAVLKTLNAG